MTNKLIKVETNESGAPVVDGRELHEFLQVATPYNKWITRMVEYGFTEGVDFWTFLSESTGGRPAEQHTLTIDMAKEISMLQRNERGKMARQHFISIEKQWNSPEQVMARALTIANQTIEKFKSQTLLLEAEVKEKDKEIAILQPKADYLDDTLKTTAGTYTLTHLCKLHGHGVLSAIKLNKMLEEDGVTRGKKHQPDQRFIDANIFTYQIPEYGEDYTGFRSRKLELRIRPQAFKYLAEEYVPLCLKVIAAEKEINKVLKARERLMAKKVALDNPKVSAKLKEQNEYLLVLLGDKQDAERERRNAIWNMLSVEKVETRFCAA